MVNDMGMGIDFLKICDEAYYNTGEPIVPDIEYDNLKDSLRVSFPDDPYFQTVGASSDGDDFPLPYILGSLNKVKPNGSTLKWIQDEKIEWLHVSAKLDGVSLYVRFENGKFIQASTRGNGYKGKLVTDKVSKICPNVHGDTFECRCEAVMTTQKALELGYKNSRNAVSGILNSDDGNNIEHVTLVFYHVFEKDFNSYSDHTSFLDSRNLKTPLHQIIPIHSIPDIEDYLRKCFLNAKTMTEFEIDGLVIANDADPIIGEDYYPKNAVAFKVNAKAIRTKVTSIDWNVGRTGKMTPVVNIQPVDIGGSTISKATGFNAKFIETNNIFPGAEIGIQRSGDVIPYITECFELFKVENILPTHCPYCDSELEYSETEVDLYCNNPHCVEKNLYQLENFLLSHGVEEITYTTLKNLKIQDITDLYILDEDDISKMDGFGEKRAKKIVSEINKTLNTTPDKLLLSFGITGIGRGLSKVLTNIFNFNELFVITPEKLLDIDGIGEVLSNHIIQGLKDNRDLYDYLVYLGLKFTSNDSEKFKGKTFALTGKSDMKRSDIENMISKNGGLVKSMSKSTSFLVTDDPSSNSGKAKKAREFGTTIISYEQLKEMVK